MRAGAIEWLNTLLRGHVHVKDQTELLVRCHKGQQVISGKYEKWNKLDASFPHFIICCVKSVQLALCDVGDYWFRNRVPVIDPCTESIT